MNQTNRAQSTAIEAYEKIYIPSGQPQSAQMLARQQQQAKKPVGPPRMSKARATSMAQRLKVFTVAASIVLFGVFGGAIASQIQSSSSTTTTGSSTTQSASPSTPGSSSTQSSNSSQSNSSSTQSSDGTSSSSGSFFNQQGSNYGFGSGSSSTTTGSGSHVS